VGRLQDRRTPLLRLHPGVRGAPGDGQLEIHDPLPGAHEVAVGATALQHERDVRVRGVGADDRRAHGRADLLVGIGDVNQSTDRQPVGGPSVRSRQLAQRPDRVQAREEAALHVRDARSQRPPAVHSERPLRDGPRSEHRIHVPDEHHRRTLGVTVPQDACDRVAVRLGVGSDLHSRSQVRERALHPGAHLVHARLGVAPAIHVDEPLQVGHVVGQHALEDAGDAGQLGGVDEFGHGRESRRSAVRTPSTAACWWVSSAHHAPHRDPPAGRPQRVPGGACPQARGGTGPATDLVRTADPCCARPARPCRAGADGRRAEPGGPARRLGGSPPSPVGSRGVAGVGGPCRIAPACASPGDHPPHVRAGPLDRGVSLARGRTCASDRGGRVRAQRPH